MRHIFFSTILFLSFVLNFYVLWRLASLFAIKRGLIFWIIVAVCSVSLIVATLIRTYSDNIISKALFMVVTDWYGILWLLFSTLIVYEIIRLFVNIKPSLAASCIVGFVGILTIIAMVNTQFIHIRKLTIPGNTDCRIVQISDIHIGSVGPYFFHRIIKKTKSLNPDLVLITGDLVDNLNENTRNALQDLKTLNVPVIFTTGNHERYVGVDRVQRALELVNVKVLRNEAIDFNQIRIIGVDDGTSSENIEQIARQLNDKSKFCILMYHRPSDLEMLSSTGANLTLSGHTHNGQIFPFNFVVRNFFRNIYGLYEYQNGNLYVTCGTGTWGPRMRLGSRSEIVFVQIKKSY